jgi:hypothetical protein
VKSKNTTEEADNQEDDEEAFGQEADLVSQVQQLLQEYGDSADFIKEFVQNADDAGATSLGIFLLEEKFGIEQVVDPRAAALQGAAIYICCDNSLSSVDIGNMQRVGQSAKRMDATTSGRFGIGMNVMYRFCDCPQLLANDSLHFFDLMRMYVAQPGMRRGRKYGVDKVERNFPDSYKPFTSDKLPHRLKSYPTIFRLALRTQTSNLGMKQEFSEVVDELKQVAAAADRMLLFTRNLSLIEFHCNTELMYSHQTSLKDQEAHDKFWSGMPTSYLALKPGKMHLMMEHMSITSEGSEIKAEGNKFEAEWACTHRVGISDVAMQKILKDQFEKPYGVALLPHGAAAVRVKPFEEEPRS